MPGIMGGCGHYPASFSDFFFLGAATRLPSRAEYGSKFGILILDDVTNILILIFCFILFLDVLFLQSWSYIAFSI